jgi:hypothetical protein
MELTAADSISVKRQFCGCFEFVLVQPCEITCKIFCNDYKYIKTSFLCSNELQRDYHKRHFSSVLVSEFVEILD